MFIKDGKGTGVTLAISADNRASVNSVTETLAHHINNEHAKAFALTFDAIDPVGADDYFFYFKNTGLKNIHVLKFRLRSTVVGSVEIHHVTGTASFTAGVDVVPVNRKIGSTNSITSVIKTDTNTTGLTNAGTLAYIRLNVADEDKIEITTDHIIIPSGQSIALLWDTGTGALTGTINIFEDQGLL